MNGNEAGTLKPTEINPKQHSYNGMSNLQPIIIDGTAIYVQARGSIIRDLGFDYQIDGYRGNDLTIFSTHLFEGHTIDDWTFQQVPNSVVWLKRDDGTMLGMTYIREHQVLAWHRHDFENGSLKQLKAIPEGTEEYVYAVIERSVNGRTVKYVERMNTRYVDPDAVEDTTILDSYLTYDGRHTGSTTMTLSGGVDWDHEETLTLTASAATFISTARDVGNEIHLTSGTEIIRFRIKGFTSTTIVTGTVNRTVPVAMRSTALTSWTYAVDEVAGLWHLEGQTVSIFADGYVLASPNNPAYPTMTVANGSLTLDRCFGVIHVGLPITSDLETLNLDTPQGETLADKAPLVNVVTAFVEKTRGLWCGTRPPRDEETDFLGGLNEFKLRSVEGYDESIDLATGPVEVPVAGQYETNGRVFLRQVDPVPATILAIMPGGYLPFKG